MLRRDSLLTFYWECVDTNAQVDRRDVVGFHGPRLPNSKLTSAWC